MLHLAIFGISGATGQALAREAVARGHGVAGLVRPGARTSPLPNQCRIVRGDLSDGTVIDDVLGGVDVVYCVFGPRPPQRDVFCATATRSIISGLNQAGVRRLICQTGAMIAPTFENVSGPMRFMAAMFARQRPEVARDRADQELIIQASGLDWTIVKPPRLVDGRTLPSGTKRARLLAGPDVRVGLMSSVGRPELAELLLDLAEKGGHLMERIYISSSSTRIEAE